MALRIDADFLSTDTEEGALFRVEVGAWLANNLPSHLRNRTHMLSPEEYMPWHKQLVKIGWAAPHWPKEHGGMDATLEQQIILNEEFARIGAPEWEAIHGIMLIGPVLLRFGTESQRQRHLGPILSGEEMWCQGYSEPGAGSDLASVQTRAVRDGDCYVVSGRKIWTTLGAQCDYMFTLLRTDPEAEKPQAGLSILIIDLNSPGVTRRPIVTIKGEPELAEILFDEVRVPAENLVGDENGGWKVANAMLGLERFNLGHPRYCFEAFEAAMRVARTTGAIDDPPFREAAARLHLDILAFTAFYRHAVELTQGGQPPQAEAAVLKIAAPQAMQDAADLMLDAAVFNGGAVALLETDDGPVDIPYLFMHYRRKTIGGGTREIQRNIIARRVLDLPRQTGRRQTDGSAPHRRTKDGARKHRQVLHKNTAQACRTSGFCRQGEDLACCLRGRMGQPF